jgi:hypothetical protein
MSAGVYSTGRAPRLCMRGATQRVIEIGSKTRLILQLRARTACDVKSRARFTGNVSSPLHDWHFEFERRAQK